MIALVLAGSIKVDFYLDGTSINVNNVTNSIWEDLKGPLIIVFSGQTLEAMAVMWVEGSEFYGQDGPLKEMDSTARFSCSNIHLKGVSKLML